MHLAIGGALGFSAQQQQQQQQQHKLESPSPADPAVKVVLATAAQGLVRLFSLGVVAGGGGGGGGGGSGDDSDDEDGANRASERLPFVSKQTWTACVAEADRRNLRVGRLLGGDHPAGGGVFGGQERQQRRQGWRARWPRPLGEEEKEEMEGEQKRQKRRRETERCIQKRFLCYACLPSLFWSFSSNFEFSKFEGWKVSFTGLRRKENKTTHFAFEERFEWLLCYTVASHADLGGRHREAHQPTLWAQSA